MAAKAQEVIKIAPQSGPQTDFLASEADIVIYGGAAGGGKTYGLLLDPLRHYSNGKFGAVIFRRTAVQIKNEGGLWDTSLELYSKFKGRPRQHTLEWQFPSGMSISFANLEYEQDVLNYQGGQMPWIGFDELTHFTEFQFFYLFSRNRSTSGAKPRIRGTCNPDPDSFVRKLIDWWIGPDGFPIKERSGVLRYFIRVNDEMVWADTKEEIYEKYGRGTEIMPTSITFIPSKLDDNRILTEKDPTYAARLLALSRVDRMRLKEGNWNVRAQAGMLFKREWFQVLDAVPQGFNQQCRYWDRAATRPSETNKDPDWTRGLRMVKYPNGTYMVTDLKSCQDTPYAVEQLVKTTASHDGSSCPVVGEQDPGSAGVADAQRFVSILAGYDARTRKPTKDKLTRAKPVSAQAEVGNVFVLRAPWNDAFFQELENFPDGAHDDIVDVLSGAFNELSGGHSILDVL